MRNRRAPGNGSPDCTGQRISLTNPDAMATRAAAAGLMGFINAQTKM
jgi:hypothetical protein